MQLRAFLHRLSTEDSRELHQGFNVVTRRENGKFAGHDA
jgi:hypothetical protein